jgi:glycosyltransferase involved in cell wall biosynthesis
MSRILIIVHGHPDISRGGGELAAGMQARQLRALGHDVLLVARQAGASGRGGTPFTLRGEDVLFHAPDYDYFLHSQRAKWSIYKDLRALIDNFAPDAAHLHHYVHMGIEVIRELRKYSASLPIVLTLHEYLAICHSHGQFLKTDFTLCEASSPSDCHRCFPEFSPQDFFLRERFIKSSLDLVDRFICPSHFLLNRYAAWGLPPEKLVFLENGQVPQPQPDPADPEILCRRFGYFGQITALKGINVLLRAVELLPPAVRARIRIDIHGTLTHQPPDFVAEIQAKFLALNDVLQYHGPYTPQDLPGLIARTGWVTVPSLWWENSPLVIQEAFANGRPVICGDIGGMAEKVTHGANGLHVRVGDARDWAETIARAADPVLWQDLASQVTPPPGIGQTTQTLLDLYAAIARQRTTPLRQPRRAAK